MMRTEVADTMSARDKTIVSGCGTGAQCGSGRVGGEGARLRAGPGCTYHSEARSGLAVRGEKRAEQSQSAHGRRSGAKAAGQLGDRRESGDRKSGGAREGADGEGSERVAVRKLE